MEAAHFFTSVNIYFRGDVEQKIQLFLVYEKPLSFCVACFVSRVMHVAFHKARALLRLTAPATNK